jgi:hypothetical protein
MVLLCRNSYTLRYLPKVWRGVNVVYIPNIPKARTKDPEQPKTYIFTFENHGKVDRPAHKVKVPRQDRHLLHKI